MHNTNLAPDSASQEGRRKTSDVVGTFRSAEESPIFGEPKRSTVSSTNFWGPVSTGGSLMADPRLRLALHDVDG